MYRGAMQSILSELVRQERLVVLDQISVERPKTKELLSQLNSLGLKEALIVTKEWDMNLYLSARNVPNVDVCEAVHVDPVSLVKYEKVIITVDALRKLEEVLGQ